MAGTFFFRAGVGRVTGGAFDVGKICECALPSEASLSTEGASSRT